MIRNALTAIGASGVLLPFAVLLELTVMPDMRLLGGGPDAVLLVVATIGMLRGPEAGALTGFAGGVLLDTLAGTTIGPSAIVYVALGHAAGRAGEIVRPSSPVRPLVVIAVLGAAGQVGTALVGFLLGEGPQFVDIVSPGALASGAVDLLIAIPFYPLLRLLLRRRVRVPSTSLSADDGRTLAT